MAELPAILGGPPAFPEGPPSWPVATPEVHAALVEAFASGAWGRYHGEHVTSLEAELARFHSVPHALSCASGTLAVEVALHALRVGPGDEVVLAAYEYESNFLTVHALGARPVLVDVSPRSWNLDPGSLKDAFTPRTKAVICSHLHGGLVPMCAVMECVAGTGIGVVEDAAQAPGALVQGRIAGTWGDVGTLSFGGSKLLTAGRGGAVLFRDSQLFQRAKLWLHRGLQQWAPLSELQAAALRPQLAHLTQANERRLSNVLRLKEELTHLGVSGLSCIASIKGDGSTPAFYKLGFQFDAGAFGLGRDQFLAVMRAEGIAVDAGFRALHVQRSPSRYRASGTLEHALAAHEGCVMLHHPVLLSTNTEMDRIAAAISKAHQHRDAIRELKNSHSMQSERISARD